MEWVAGAAFLLMMLVTFIAFAGAFAESEDQSLKRTMTVCFVAGVLSVAYVVGQILGA